MNSFNHYAYGAIGAWMYAVIGGIDVDPDQPGYKQIVMRPCPGGGVTHATAELQSPYGLVRSAWTQENGHFDWTVVIPPNSAANVYVPAESVSAVMESGQSLETASGVTFVRVE